MAHLGEVLFLRFNLYTYDGRVRGCWCNVLLFVFLLMSKWSRMSPLSLA